MHDAVFLAVNSFGVGAALMGLIYEDEYKGWRGFLLAGNLAFVIYWLSKIAAAR